MPQFLKSIITRRLPCFFISPHFDDAALSAASLMRYLVKSGVRVTVVNIFTHPGTVSHQTLSAKKYVSSTGFSDPVKLYSARQSEDYQALSRLGVQVVNLDLTEALWRRRELPAPLFPLSRFLPEIDHIYPLYRWHIIRGVISPHDQPTVVRLTDKLAKIIPARAVVFCPLGIGGHVDHVLTRVVCDRLFKPIYWLDQPYYFRQKNSLRCPGLSQEKFPVNVKLKKKFISLYRTQVTRLFKNGKIPLLEEIFCYA